MTQPAFIGPADYQGRATVRPCGLCDGRGRHEFGECRSCNGSGFHAFKACHECGESRGGVVGNGQWVGGVLLCDYCHADQLGPRQGTAP